MPGRPDNAIKNHFNTSMQRKRRRLSLQDPSELQLNFSDNGPGLSTSPLASPTSTTSPPLARHNRFDPYERRHSMPSLELPPNVQAALQQIHTHGQQPVLHGSNCIDQGEHSAPSEGHANLSPPHSSQYQQTSVMSRSISLGSSSRVSGSFGSNKTTSSNAGQVRPNLPGNPQIHRSSHSAYFASTSAAMVQTSSHTTSLSSSSPGKPTRSQSFMAVSTGHSSPLPPPPHSPFSKNTEDQCRFYQQEQQMNRSLPRPNMTRHASLGHGVAIHHHPHHEHRRSLDSDPFSALAELANLAEQCREMPTGFRSETVVIQTKDGDDEELEHDARPNSWSSSHQVDIEEEVAHTAIKSPMTRRFSTLDNLREEDHAEEHEHEYFGHSHHHNEQQHHQPQSHCRQQYHHYHGDHESNANTVQSNQDRTGSPLNHGDYYSFGSGRSSVEYSNSDHGSDYDKDVRMDEDHKVRKETSYPKEPYLAMRRSSVRELMAIDHLCLSSEEVERR
ncbi:hypothetical protein BGZ74_008597 [Mortierella antarctica]|nr:hypothetical protein BGZ74_008597 [Mortierella antarctica]